MAFKPLLKMCVLYKTTLFICDIKSLNCVKTYIIIDTQNPAVAPSLPCLLVLETVPFTIYLPLSEILDNPIA